MVIKWCIQETFIFIKNNKNEKCKWKSEQNSLSEHLVAITITMEGSERTLRPKLQTTLQFKDNYWQIRTVICGMQ